MAFAPVSGKSKRFGQRSFGFRDVEMDFATKHNGAQQSNSRTLYMLAVPYSTAPVSLELTAATCYAPNPSKARAAGGSAEELRGPGQRTKQEYKPKMAGKAKPRDKKQMKETKKQKNETYEVKQKKEGSAPTCRACDFSQVWDDQRREPGNISHTSFK